MSIYKEIKLNSINNLYVEIEPTFNDELSIVAYDELETIWIEKFAKTQEKAIEIADNLIEELTKKHNL
jgi:hypothetical protein